MTLITSDTILRQYIPNLSVTIEGETTYFERIKTELISAESWLSSILMPVSDITGDDNINLARKVVAAYAFALAVPQLDIFLTTNGFGIISNSNMAPASRDRVNALVEGLYRTRDAALQTLIIKLKEQAPVKARFYSTLFVGLEAQKCQQATKAYEQWVQQQPDIIDIEARIGYQYISSSLMAKLRTDSLSAAESNLKDRLKAIVLEVLNTSSKNLPNDKLLSCVTTIRQTEELYNQWKDSLTAKIYADYSFQNDKNSGGFWL